MSRRTTVRVDWDSPSTETGTVKRRPLSMSIAQATKRSCFEDVKYYDFKSYSRSSSVRHLSSFNDTTLAKIQEKSTTKHRQSFPNKSIQLNPKSFMKATVNSSLRINTNNRSQLSLSMIKNAPKSVLGREVGQKITTDALWKTRKPEKRSIPSADANRNTKQSQSGIPRPRIYQNASTSVARSGLVNSSSESSGIGSPLSPLSPQNDVATPEGVIKPSGSRSSGLGSPDSLDSPLSPDSQQYAALYLIQQQLEKLHNCSCERRQAEVDVFIFQMIDFVLFILKNRRPLW